MYGWIICNGALNVSKIDKLVENLHFKARSKNMDIDIVKNNRILPFYDENSNPKIISMDNLRLPDYVIFWDKDILLARHLELMGIKLFNSRLSIELCDNKALMMTKISNSGLKIPKTVIAPFVFFDQNIEYEYYSYLTKLLGNELILKESLGSFGMQVYKANNFDEFSLIVKKITNKSFIIQENISCSFARDIRVNIVGNKVIGAMLRTGKSDFRANITLGATAEKINLTKKQEEMALKAHQILGLDFSGVDLLFGKNDEPILCEVNSNVNFLSFEETTCIDFGSAILQHVFNKMNM